MKNDERTSCFTVIILDYSMIKVLATENSKFYCYLC